METLTIEVEARDGSGKGPARRVRMTGKIPAVFYGAKAPAKSIAVDRKQFTQRIANLEGAHLIELRSGDPGLDKRKVLMRDIQFDPVAGTALHADFYEVDLDQAIEVRVPLHFEGKAAGVTAGGILQPLLRELAVLCLPTHIPDFITVDVTALGIHDSIHANDLRLPDGVKVAVDSNEAVVTVVPPTVEAKPAGDEAAAEGAVAAPDAGDAKKGDAKKPEAKKADAKK